MKRDQELTALIKSDLLNDTRLASHPITVSVSDGIVTLDGTVLSHRRQLLAHEIAACHEGVRDVINRLIVEPLTVGNDEEIATDVRAALDANAEITKQTVAVSVVGGKVTLTGNVRSHWERAIAEDVARSTHGVRAVHNLLRVNLEGKVDDSELASAISAALKRSSGIKDSELSVAVSNGQVVLSGEVKALWLKEMAGKVAAQFGAMYVRNEIVVVVETDFSPVVYSPSEGDAQ